MIKIHPNIYNPKVKNKNMFHKNIEPTKFNLQQITKNKYYSFCMEIKEHI